jgi:hypothetical protein
MTSSYRLVRLSSAVLVAGCLWAVACGSNSPTTPTPGQGPVITDISPSTFIAGPLPQAVVVRGDQFIAGLTLLVRQPDTTILNVGSDRLQNLTNSSFQTTLTFALAGTYTISIRNANGAGSPDTTVRVDPASNANTTPNLTSISPASLVLLSSPQLITLAGDNFSSPMLVTIIDPTLQTSTIGMEAISGLTSTSFVLSMTANKRGLYLISVQNSTGQISNTVSLAVN